MPFRGCLANATHQQESAANWRKRIQTTAGIRLTLKKDYLTAAQPSAGKLGDFRGRPLLQVLLGYRMRRLTPIPSR